MGLVSLGNKFHLVSQTCQHITVAFFQRRYQALNVEFVLFVTVV